LVCPDPLLVCRRFRERSYGHSRKSTVVITSVFGIGRWVEDPRDQATAKINGWTFIEKALEKRGRERRSKVFWRVLERTKIDSPW
jgi:hypothetical protein